MSQTAIFWPMIVQTALIYAIYFTTSIRRVKAVKTGVARAGDFKLPFTEPAPSATAIRNLANQFELPVLFYVVCLSLYVLNGATLIAVLLAWAFVISRILHAGVHVTSNDLRLRRPLFIAGIVINALLWVWLAMWLLRG
ncbi:membrane protein [Brucella endophytica]|uniref:Membrane protein n=1 Tax=Brucella endophytica TaxID=1963359 RepID=A0A916S0A5_9HYPH|nr:MAPEG family protein [Brucella endophytica]GGA77817.1 membrane protein [Brucella endophytica]